MRANIITVFLLGLSASLFGQKIIGYIPQYRTTAQMDAAIEWDKMTDYYYFGSYPNGNGTITVEQQARFDHVKAKATTYSKNIWLSVGGWGKSSNFITVANSASLSQTFANEALSLCQTHGLTGIDIDWEFPSYGQETAFKNFFKILYETLNPQGYKVSAAAGGEATHADKWQAETFNYIDDLNIMSYDDPSLTSGNHSSLQFMQNSMSLYAAQGCPYSKMLGGVAFYSRCAGVLMYSDIMNGVGAGSPATTYENDVTSGYCYNGRATIEAKIDYVMNQGGIGVLIWEVTQDVLGQYSLLNACDVAMDDHRCAAPTPNLGNDVDICGQSSVTLDGGVSPQSGVTFTWKQGTTTLVNQSASASTYAATSAGTYTLEVWQGGCNRSDEIEVTGVLSTPDIGGPYDLCDPISVTLDAGVTGGGKTIEWQKNDVAIPGETSSTLVVSTAGTYKVVVSASGCTTVEDQATVTSSLPTAENDTVCNSGDQATITASESVNWYSSESAPTELATGTTYSPTVTGNTTYWMGGTGAAATQHTTMRSQFTSGWQANSQVYGTKLTVESELTIDEVTVNANGGSVTVNLVGSDGTTVVQTKTFGSVSGETALSLGWTAIAPGTYYLNTVGSGTNLYVGTTKDGSNYNISGVLTVDLHCYEDWSAPYGDGYVASQNYGNFINLKVTVGNACARVPVQVIVDSNNPACLFTGVEELGGSVEIYPNPSANDFQISGVNSGIAVIYDATGTEVESVDLSVQSVFGANLNPGVYIVVIGGGESTQRIIKQ